MNKVELRKNELLEILHSRKRMRISEVSEVLNISIPTARRLCVALAEEEKINRIHGSISSLDVPDDKYSFEQLKNEHLEEKIKVGNYAASLIKNNQVIFLEAGTTIQQMALALAERIKKGELTGLVIFTNSLLNLEILHPVQEKIILLGGQYREQRRDFVGYFSELSLKKLQFDCCFMGADAISTKGGIMAMDLDTVRFDAELIKHSENVIILAHSGKFDKNSLISYVDLNEVSSIITDRNLNDAIFTDCENAGANIIRV